MKANMTKTTVAAVVLLLQPLASLAESPVQAICQYRHAHGLSSVVADTQLTEVAQRQAQAMAASGVMDHNVAGSFSSRISGVKTNHAAENIAAGTKTWSETLAVWEHSSGHNANLLMPGATHVGVAVAHNASTRYKTYWAMVIATKSAFEGTKVKKLKRAPAT